MYNGCSYVHLQNIYVESFVIVHFGFKQCQTHRIARQIIYFDYLKRISNTIRT
jgi:hypothetical protein